MELTFCYLVPTISTRFSIAVPRFDKHKNTFSKWYSTFFYYEYFRNYSKKSKKVPKQVLHNFANFFLRSFFLEILTIFSVK